MNTGFFARMALCLATIAALPHMARAGEGDQKQPAAKADEKGKAAKADASKPKSRVELEQQWLACRRRLSVEAYRQHGKRDPRWDTEAEAFLDEWAIATGHMPWPLHIADRALMGKVALKLGCTDPLVRAVHLLAVSERNGTISSEHLELSREMKAANYPPLLTAYFAGLGMFAHGSKANFNEEKHRESIQLMLEEISRLLQDDSLRPGDERIAYNFLDMVFAHRHDAWFEAQPQVEKLVESAKEPHQKWLAHMAAAAFCKSKGWGARGGGWASTVTPEGWRVFHEQLDRMVEHLRAANDLIPTHPEAACEMITALANGRGEKEGETMLTWFERAVAAQCDYEDAYSSMLHFGAPRWGGSHKLMEQIGRRGLDTGRFDTEAPFQYFNAIVRIAHDVPETEQAFWHSEIAKYYPRLKQMFVGYQSEPRQQDRLLFFTSLHAVVAYHADQPAEALELLRKTNDKFHADAVKYGNYTQEELLTNIHAEGGKAGRQVAEMISLMEENKIDEVQKRIDEASKIYEAENDQHALKLLKRYASMITLRKGLASHEWLDLKFDDALSGWSKAAGNWKRKDDNTVAGTPTKSGFYLKLDEAVGHRLQLRAEVQIPKTRFGTDNAGLIVAHSLNPDNRAFWSLVYPEPKDTRYYVGLTPNHEKPTAGDVRLDRNLLEVTLWDRSVQVKLNGEVIRRNEWLDEDAEFGADEHIGLGGNYNYDGPEVLFRNVRIRKLRNPPDGF
jgi:hypothetical protein